MTKTPTPAQPDLAILAGVPAGVRAYLSQLARHGGWKVADGDEARLAVRVDNGEIIFARQGMETKMTLPLRASKILSFLQSVQRGAGSLPDKISIGAYTLMPQDYLIVDPEGLAIRLTEKETAILVFLARAGGRPVTRQALLDEVWAYAEGVETHTLETHIYRLRQKIEENPASPVCLLTLEDGYALKL